MIKIIFLNNWGDSPEKQLERYIYQTPNHDGIWENLQGTTNFEEADYFIITDGLPENIKPDSIPANKKIYLQREPKAKIKKHAFEKDKAIFKGSYNNHYHVATWQIRIPFKKLEALAIPKYEKNLSTIVSAKSKTRGQRRRLKIVKKLNKIYPEMDIYGRGLSKFDFKDSYKGILDYNEYCKFNGIYGYKYSLAFENSSQINYFTEKIIDCILSWAKPIYWGCENINEYFPKESYTYIDINKMNAHKKILAELTEPINYDALAEARKLILYKYNIWPSVKKIIDSLTNQN